MKSDSLRRWIDLAVISVIGVLVGLTFGLPLSSMEQFTVTDEANGGLGAASLTPYSLVSTGFPVGQALGAYVVGWALARYMAADPHRSHHAGFALSILLIAVGALTYWLGNHIALVGIGRMLQGMGSAGLQTVVRSQLNRSTEKAFVTVVTTATASFVSIFMGVGPAISSAFADIEPLQLAPGVRIDKFRVPAVFLLGSAGVVLLLLPLMSDRVNVHRRPPPSLNVNSEAAPLLPAKPATPPAPPARTWLQWALSPVAAMLIINSGLSATFAGYETVAAPLLARKFGTSIGELGSVFLYSSLAAAATFVVVAALLRPRAATGRPSVPANVVLLLVLFLSVTALLFLADFGALVQPLRRLTELCASATSSADACDAMPWCAWTTIHPPVCRVAANSLDALTVAALALINISFVVGRVVSSGQFMTLLHAENSAKAAAVLQVVSSLARVVAPLVFIQLLDALPVFPALWPFALSGALMLLVTVHFLVTWRDRARDAARR